MYRPALLDGPARPVLELAVRDEREGVALVEVVGSGLAPIRAYGLWLTCDSGQVEIEDQGGLFGAHPAVRAQRRLPAGVVAGGALLGAAGRAAGSGVLARLRVEGDRAGLRLERAELIDRAGRMVKPLLVSGRSVLSVPPVITTSPFASTAMP